MPKEDTRSHHKLASSFVAGDDGRTKRRKAKKERHNKTSPRELWLMNTRLGSGLCSMLQVADSIRDTNRITMIAMSPEHIGGGDGEWGLHTVVHASTSSIGRVQYT
jgi:hypothetical protein